jgi:cytoskeleton protein RodZ
MSLGQQLQAAREKKGVSIEKAAEDTKVRADVLRALESDDYSAMRAPVYAKGFLKIYSQYLGMDAAAMRAQYDEMVRANAPPPPPLHTTATHLKQSPVDRLISSVATMWGMWVLVGAIIVVLILIISVVISATRRARTPVSERAPVPVATSLSTHTSAATNSSSSSADAYIKPIQPRAGMLEAVGTNASSKTASPSAASLQAPLTLSVRLTEDSWVEVVVDGHTLPYRIQKAGWHKEWSAQKSIVLRVGNAGGVQAKRNGKDVGPLGKRHERVEKEFTK